MAPRLHYFHYFVLGFGFHKNNLVTRYGNFDYNTGLNTNTNKVFIKGNEVDLGLKFYFRNHRAPLGNSMDIFVKKQFYKIDGTDVTGNMLEIYSLDMTLLGAKLNYITMISSKLPIYFKYGFSFFVPVKRIQEFVTVKTNISETIEESINLSNHPWSEDDYTAVSNYRNINWFKVHIGLGFAF